MIVVYVGCGVQGIDPSLTLHPTLHSNLNCLLLHARTVFCHMFEQLGTHLELFAIRSEIHSGGWPRYDATEDAQNHVCICTNNSIASWHYDHEHFPSH